MTSTAPLPSIVVNVPQTTVVASPTDPISATGQDPNGTTYTARPVSPGRINTEVTTTPFPSKDPSQQSCYLCDEQNPGDFSPTTKYLETCLLCSRSFCPIHKATQWNGVCNINHSKYYHECFDRAKEELTLRSPDGATRPTELEVEQDLIASGIYPSMGERERALFKTSPVSNGKYKVPCSVDFKC